MAKKTKERIRSEAHKAQTILDDTLFDQVVIEVQQDLFLDWRVTEKTEEREKLHGMAVGLEILLTRLRAKADQLTIEAHKQ
jgi:hypothetical protein